MMNLVPLFFRIRHFLKRKSNNKKGNRMRKRNLWRPPLDLSALTSITLCDTNQYFFPLLEENFANVDGLHINLSGM